MNPLHAALDRALVLPPEYRAGLSNHLPMALHALHELGADPNRLIAFARQYTARFAVSRPAQLSTLDADWREALGRFDAYDAFQRHFADRIRAVGRDATLRESLPALAPGLAAAAFHGLIRTAHAVQAAHDGELASALAYWAARWQPLPEPEAGSVHLPVNEWVDTLAAHAQGWRSAAPLISGRIAAVAQTPAYRQLGRALHLEPDTPADLWRQAATLYAASGNFTILHVVTGCRAIHVLAPCFDPQQTLWRHAVPAVAAAILASGMEAGTKMQAPSADWGALAARAIACDDDHVIKLVHAARDGERRVGGEAFRAAAARALA